MVEKEKNEENTGDFKSSVDISTSGGTPQQLKLSQ
jgi:hypothetical protein